MAIRSPIVTVAGHVDHGKTSLLDRLRETAVVEKEAGKITQKISFTYFPAENIKRGCYLLDKYGIPLKIPGFLLIDTPGHQAFTNLRKRGGSLADLAIVVIDIREGVMPQTSEVLQILRANKTPFIVALNKIDALSGWKQVEEDLRKSIESQAMHVKEQFDEKYYTILSALDSHGYKADLFWNVEDFTKKIAIVPISAKTGEGVAELLMVLCGLSQKFLTQHLNLSEEAKGVIFEVKKEKAMNYVEAVLYDGKLKINDEIAIASFGKPIVTKIRSLEKIENLSDKFDSAKEVIAATGIRMNLTGKEEILPGMPFQIFNNNLAIIEKEFGKDLGRIETAKDGIIIKADSLGTLEALMLLLNQANIKVLRAGIGKISKQDIVVAKSNREIDPLNSVILGFNVEVDEEAKEMEKEVRIFSDEVVYKLIEDLQKWQENKRKEIERERLIGLSSLFKVEILSKYVFRNSNPAIFGVKVLGGKLRAGAFIIDDKNEKIGKLKGIQAESKSVDDASVGMEVAISIPGLTFDRQLKESKFLYSDLGESQFKDFKKNKELLSSDEMKVLHDIAEIKRREKATWGV